MSGTDTRSTVFDGFVGDRKFTQIMSNHLGLDSEGEKERCGLARGRDQAGRRYGIMESN